MDRTFLALRYLVARPISWISMVGICLGVTALLATLSIMAGFLRDTRAMIRGTTSDLVVTPTAEGEGTAGYERFEELLAAQPGVAATAPHLLRPALLRVPDVVQEKLVGDRRFFDLNFVRVVGVDPGREGGATGFRDWLSRGLGAEGAPDPERPFAIDERLVPPEYRNLDLPVLLVGERLARFFDLGPGRVVTLVTLPEEVQVDEPKALTQRFVVGGTFRTGHLETDRTTVFASLDAVERFADTARGASEICVRAQPGVDLTGLRDRLAAALERAGLEARVETWEDRHRTFLRAVENERAVLGFLLFFFVAVACFNVFATLTIMVTDKTRDIGVLAALGATRPAVAGVFLRCGLAMSLSSSALGCALGSLLALRINAVDDLLAWAFGLHIFRRDVFAFDRIPVDLDARLVFVVFVSTNLFAAVCALLPSLRAARLDPVGALRHE